MSVSLIGSFVVAKVAEIISTLFALIDSRMPRLVPRGAALGAHPAD